MKTTSLIITSALACMSLSHAATYVVDSSAPTVDGADIAMLNTTSSYDIGPDEGHIWSDRGRQGQTFTTGSNTDGYMLHAITLRTRSNSNTSQNSSVFTIRVGSINGDGDFVPLLVESENNAGSVSAGDYITANLNSSIHLAANTQYAFDLGVSGFGFVTDNNDDSNYTGGQAYSSGDNNTPDDSNLVYHAGDRVFHLDMTAHSSVPEPSSAVLIGLGGLGVFLRRSR